MREARLTVIGLLAGTIAITVAGCGSGTGARPSSSPSSTSTPAARSLATSASSEGTRAAMAPALATRGPEPTTEADGETSPPPVPSTAAAPIISLEVTPPPFEPPSTASSPAARADTASPEATPLLPTAAVPTAALLPPYTEAQARALLPLTMVHESDLTGSWTTNEIEQSNAELAAADPTQAAIAERCGRVLGRSTTLRAEDDAAAYRDKQLVAVNASVGVYATTAGAADCFDEAVARYHRPGELARAFGSVFPDPEGVTIDFVDVPRLGEASLAATAAGMTPYFALNIPISVYVVEFRYGNVIAIVAVARQPVPTADDLAALARLVLDRIVANR